MVPGALRAVWGEPRVPAPAARPWWDVAVVAALLPTAVIEGIVRDDVVWPPYAIGWAMVCVVAVLWRARYPLGMLLLAFAAQTLAGLGSAAAGLDGTLYTTAVVLLFPYSLARWDSGRHVTAGVVVLMAFHLGREIPNGSPVGEILAGTGFLLFPVVLGAAVRFGVSNRQREAEQVRMRERERLARELHDTVAHHISGILLQTQAGQAVAVADPQRALSVLAVIEKEAARVLTEMRTLVGVLRDGTDHERAPVHGIADLPTLVADPADGLSVQLAVSGDVADVGAAVDAAVYRVVQESVTNTRRHAHGATRLTVQVRTSEEVVHVDVVDDGAGGRAYRRSSLPGHGTGHGIPGMRERVELLGGQLRAGPLPDGGWAVAATIPRTVTSR